MALAVLTACGGGQAEMTPEAGLAFGRPPILQGRSVMVLPVQATAGIPSSLRPEAELTFALQERGPDVGWILPDELRQVQRRSPGVDLSLDNLPVGFFLQAQVRRVGDPLYGHLRRLGGITGADLALVPVRVRFRPAGPEREAGVELAVAVIDVRSGRVPWFGIVDGEPGEADDPRTLASAADALARMVAR